MKLDKKDAGAKWRVFLAGAGIAINLGIIAYSLLKMPRDNIQNVIKAGISATVPYTPMLKNEDRYEFEKPNLYVPVLRENEMIIDSNLMRFVRLNGKADAVGTYSLYPRIEKGYVRRLERILERDGYSKDYSERFANLISEKGYILILDKAGEKPLLLKDIVRHERFHEAYFKMPFSERVFLEREYNHFIAKAKIVGLPIGNHGPAEFYADLGSDFRWEKAEALFKSESPEAYDIFKKIDGSIRVDLVKR